MRTARHDRAGRVALFVARLVAGAAALVAATWFVFVYIGDRRPGLAIMILILAPLFALSWHDQRRHARIIEESRRDALAASARKAACPDCYGTGVWRGTGWAEPCPTCKGGRR